MIPSSWLSGWNSTSSGLTGRLTLAPWYPSYIHSVAGTGTSGQYVAVVRSVSEPLAAQTISGTLKGLVTAMESSATADYTIAVGAKVIKPDGTDRGVLLNPTAPNDLTYEISTNALGRRLMDASENADIALSSVTVSRGDRLVVEVGFYSQSTSTATCYLYMIPETTDVADWVDENSGGAGQQTWVEFSQDIVLAAGDYFGSVSIPVDGSSATNATTTITLTPYRKSFMKNGDLVVVFCQSRASTTWSVGVTGGQTWTSETAFAATTNVNGRVFWCTFNGTWSADPRFDSTSGTCTSAVMHVFRPGVTGSTWDKDIVQSALNLASSSSFTGYVLTTTQPSNVIIQAWFTADDNTWGNINVGPGYTQLGEAQYRNTSSTDQSSAYVYYLAPDAVTSLGNPQIDLLTLGSDAATGWSMSFYATAPVAAKSFVFSPSHSSTSVQPFPLLVR